LVYLDENWSFYKKRLTDWMQYLSSENVALFDRWVTNPAGWGVTWWILQMRAIK
jgi:hypothetical protein